MVVSTPNWISALLFPSLTSAAPGSEVLFVTQVASALPGRARASPTAGWVFRGAPYLLCCHSALHLQRDGSQKPTAGERRSVERDYPSLRRHSTRFSRCLITPSLYDNRIQSCCVLIRQNLTWRGLSWRQLAWTAMSQHHLSIRKRNWDQYYPLHVLHPFTQTY